LYIVQRKTLDAHLFVLLTYTTTQRMERVVKRHVHT